MIESELRAETALMLRNAAMECDKLDNLPSEIKRRILALIPTDYAATLAERDDRMREYLLGVPRMEGWLPPNEVNERVREAQLKEHYEWPDPPPCSENCRDWAKYILELSNHDSERIAQLRAATTAEQEVDK